MRVRWILLAGVIGFLIAWRYENLVALYVTAFGCLILLGLRRISSQLDEQSKNGGQDF
jgi:hypothetical protein